MKQQTTRHSGSPNGRGSSRVSELGWNLLLIDRHSLQVSCFFEVLVCSDVLAHIRLLTQQEQAHLGACGLDSIHHDSATKVPAEIDKVSTLFYDRSAGFALVPPYVTLNLSVRANVFGNCHHDGLACRFDDVLHVLNYLEVAEHIAYTSYGACLLQVVSQVDGILDRCGGDRLLDEKRCFREMLENLDFQIDSWSVSKHSQSHFQSPVQQMP